MIAGARFHHIGVACRDLDAEERHFAALGYTVEGPSFVDPKQGITGRFLVASGQPRLELLVNSGATGPLDPWLEKGVKFYHFAYEVLDLAAAIDELKVSRARVVVPPVEAVAFHMRQIAFLMQANGMLTEFIESPTGEVS